ncbi:MAG: TatD family hydrolase [Lactovum sp.]
MLKIFDSHTHLNSKEFIGREDEIIQQALLKAVNKINVVGTDKKTNDLAIQYAEKYPQCYATIGWHPDEATLFDGESEEYLKKNLNHPRVLALGEIGLDYHWMKAPKWLQADVFCKQIRYSKEINKPFMVHTREALEDTYQILKEETIGPAGAIMHSFSASYEEAKKFLELGVMLSISGVVTFKKSLELQELVKKVPLDCLLVETDAPYLSPVPFRGKENQPAYVYHTLEKISELREIPLEKLAEIIYQNSLRIFKLEEN